MAKQREYITPFVQSTAEELDIMLDILYDIDLATRGLAQRLTWCLA